MSDEQDPNTGSNDKILAEKEKHFFNLAMRGELDDAGGPVRNYFRKDGAFTPERSRKRRKSNYEMIEFQRAFDQLMTRLSHELDIICQALEKIEEDMMANRAAWETNIETLNEIDEILTQAADYGHFDLDRVQALLGDQIDVQNGHDTTQLIQYLEELRIDKHQNIEQLDQGFSSLEHDHMLLNDRQQKLWDTIQTINEIQADQTIDEEEKLELIAQINTQIHANDVHRIANEVLNPVVNQSLDNHFREEQDAARKTTFNPVMGFTP